MGVEYSVEWGNIIVGIVTIFLGIGFTMMRQRLIGSIVTAVGTGFVIYYCFLGLWLGEKDWTIYAWAIGLGIFVFVSTMIMPLDKNESEDK